MKQKCRICNEEIQRSQHIYNCSKRNKLDIEKKELLKKQFIFTYGQDVINEIIAKYSEGIAVYELGKIYNNIHIKIILEINDVALRNISQSKMTKHTKNKFLNTMEEKYGIGIVNPSQIPDIKDKIKNSFTEKYGVDNVRKSDWFKQHYKDIMQERYGKGSLSNINGQGKITWAAKTKEERQKHFRPANDVWKIWYYNMNDEELSNYYKSRLCKTFKGFGTSSLEIFLSETLDKLDIKYIWQFVLGGKIFDFRISDTNILIEVNGNFWHANPKMYEGTNFIKYPGEEPILVQDRWKRDEIKSNIAIDHNYKLITIWETDIKENKKHFTDYLKNLLDTHNIL